MLGRLFYVFTGLHSFLIGLFPFYISVYLYTIGLTLGQICLFVSATGTGYCLSLYLWDRVCRRVSFTLLIVWSFCSEFLLLSLFFFAKEPSFVLWAGLANGVFNCNFWTIQRLLFVGSIGPENSGRNYGNSQIFVLIVLKTGILAGGFFLEQWGLMAVFLSSGVIVLLSAAIIAGRGMAAPVAETVKRSQPLTLSAIFRFKDPFHSRPVFIIDGVFLYLESYFWVLSLFFIVRESFLRLGLVVIMLAVVFGVLFLFIKNSIDSLPNQKVYVVAVALYALSWVLRGLLGENHCSLTMLWLLALITLCTSLFRLSFNKRFFDNARCASAHEYIFIKSYISQFLLALFFVIMAGMLKIPGSVVGQLSGLYFIAAVASLVYLLYRTAPPQPRMKFDDKVSQSDAA